MHKDTQTRPATLTYIRLDGYRKGDRRFKEKRGWRGEKEKKKRRGDRRRTDGGEGRDRGEDKEGRSRRRDLFMIDLPRSPRPLSHVIIRRVFDLHSLWKRCVSAHSCVC